MELDWLHLLDVAMFPHFQVAVTEPADYVLLYLNGSGVEIHIVMNLKDKKFMGDVLVGKHMRLALNADYCERLVTYVLEGVFPLVGGECYRMEAAQL
jgi:hypothetical protein